jgi:hypothetical protein
VRTERPYHSARRKRRSVRARCNGAIAAADCEVMLVPPGPMANRARPQRRARSPRLSFAFQRSFGTVTPAKAILPLILSIFNRRSGDLPHLLASPEVGAELCPVVLFRCPAATWSNAVVGIDRLWVSAAPWLAVGLWHALRATDALPTRSIGVRAATGREQRQASFAKQRRFLGARMLMSRPFQIAPLTLR